MSTAPPIPEELWRKVPPDAQAAILAVLASMQAQIDALTARVRELEARLNLNSSNSSKPPSSDPPNAKRRPPAPPSGKRRGGQPGHKRHHRELVQPDEVVPCIPKVCSKCEEVLTGVDPEPRRHQVTEIPPITPQVVEYQVHRLTCTKCGTHTQGVLPDGVPTGNFGFRLQALLSLLAGGYRISKRNIKSLCLDLFNLKISTGAISKLEQKGSEALNEAYTEAHEAVKTCDAANVDETGWVENRTRAVLWVAVAACVTFFKVCRTRGADSMKELLGEALKMVGTTDRLSTYSLLPNRQICWAHLRRDFQAMIDRGGGGEEIGGKLLIHSSKVFQWWRDFQEGRLSRWTLRQYVSQLRSVVRLTLKKGSECGCPKTASVCSNLLEDEEKLWTFARCEGVGPDNNPAERALRHGVIWRKTSYGTASERGSRFVERMLTVVETCRRRKKNLLEFLKSSLEARAKGETGPSLFA